MLVRYVFLVSTLLKQDLVDKPLGTLMNQQFHKTKMPQAKQPQVAFHQNPSGLLQPPAVAQKKHISYGRRDDYILEIEQQLMHKYRVGYSGLHKLLVIKEGNQQFSRPFV